MSFYNGYYNTDSEEIIANESCSGAVGAWSMAEEQEEAQMAMFEAVIGMDFEEAAQKHGLVQESAVEALNEASVKEIADKIIAAIVAFGEKIKGLIMNLVKKFQALFTTDGKKLVKNHEKAINEKINKGLLTKIKYKYSEFTAPSIKVMEALDATLGKKIVESMAEAHLHNAAGNAGNAGNDVNLPKAFTTEQLTTEKEEFLSKFTKSSTTVKDFKKDLMETCFADVDEKEGYDSSMHNKIKEVLVGHKTLMNDLKKQETATNKTIKEWKTAATKLQQSLDKAAKGEAYTNSHKRAAGIVGQVQQLLTAASSVTGTAYSSIADAYKKDYAQCRAIWIKMVGTNGKDPSKLDESAILDEAIMENSYYEVDEIWVEA